MNILAHQTPIEHLVSALAEQQEILKSQLLDEPEQAQKIVQQFVQSHLEMTEEQTLHLFKTPLTNLQSPEEQTHAINPTQLPKGVNFYDQWLISTGTGNWDWLKLLQQHTR